MTMGTVGAIDPTRDDSGLESGAEHDDPTRQEFADAARGTRKHDAKPPAK